MRIAIYNNKGGVGKTTTAANLGAALAHLGYRTLIVDMDPQSHVARHFGMTPSDLPKGVEAALIRRSPTSVSELVIEISKNLCLVPSTDRLNELRSELENRINSTTVLSARLKPIAEDFEFILFDTPPDRGVFSRNAMYASDTILVPINLECFAVSGIDPVMDEIIELQEAFEDQAWRIQVATLRYDARLRRNNEQCRKQVEEVFGSSGHLLETMIRTDARVGSAQLAGQSIFAFDEASDAKSPSKAAKDYLSMAQELIELK